MRRRRPIERLEDMLCDLGFKIPYRAIQPARGYWKNQDVFRWEARLVFEGREVSVFSWNTVSDCVRFGISAHKESFYEFEICARHESRSGAVL